MDELRITKRPELEILAMHTEDGRRVYEITFASGGQVRTAFYDSAMSREIDVLSDLMDYRNFH